MNEANIELAQGLVSKVYLQQGGQAISRRQALVKALLSNRRLPLHGWDDTTIEMLLQDLAVMDSNNFLGAVGMGEREARCASALVHRRHYGLTHGIGRSGNITDEQPKAAGSTLLARLTNMLVKDALRTAGMTDVEAVTVLPVATGMALMLSLLALKRKRPPGARYVLWPRIDQKTCVKAVVAAGLDLVVVPNSLEGDQVCTDVRHIEREIERLGADNVVCVLTTTSCFAPRAADRVEDVARLCAKASVGHIINNAYGVQASQLCASIARAWRRGRVDAVVQSTDKNFMVPVGGSVVAAGPKDASLVSAVNANYPGRASISPVADVFITLLSLGSNGWKSRLEEREGVYQHLKEKLKELASAQGERVLETPDNPISLGISLSGLEAKLREKHHAAAAISGHAVSAPVPVEVPETEVHHPPAVHLQSARCHPLAPSEKAEHKINALPAPDGIRSKDEEEGEHKTPYPAVTRAHIHGMSAGTAEQSACEVNGCSHTGSVASRSSLDKDLLGSCDPANGSKDEGQGRQGEHTTAGHVSGSSAEEEFLFSSGSAVLNPTTASGFGDFKGEPCCDVGSADQSAPALREDSLGPAEESSATAGLTDFSGLSAEMELSASEDGKSGIELGHQNVDSSVRSSLTFFGSMLFARGVSGCRVVARGDQKSVAGHNFCGFGSSHDAYPASYLTAAAAIGTSRHEVDEFIRQLDHCFHSFAKKKKLHGK